jgi:branched-chain amino acid transport system permease protein
MDAHLQTFLQQLLNGVVWGSIYALIALGYTMVYGILRLINFAHGDVYMFGAFMGYYAARMFHVVEHPGVLGTLLVFAFSMAISGLLGFLIERGAYRELRKGSRVVAYMIVGAAILAALNGAALHLQGAAAWLLLGGGFALGGLVGHFAERNQRHTPSTSRLTALITAIGVSLLLENGGLLVFGADPKFFPEILPTRDLNLGGIRVSSSLLIVLAVAVVLMFLLRFVVLHTRVGKAMRAVSFNRDAASLMGVPTDTIISLTFVGGSMLAAAAGILVGMANPKIDPLMGIMPGLKAFVAAVLGGIGNIPGAVLGGLLMGITETLVVAYVSSTYRDAIAFALLIVILLVRA